MDRSEMLTNLLAHKYLLCGIIEEYINEEGLLEAVKGLYDTVDERIRNKKKIHIPIINKLINYTYYILGELSEENRGAQCTIVRMISNYLNEIVKDKELINYEVIKISCKSREVVSTLSEHKQMISNMMSDRTCNEKLMGVVEGLYSFICDSIRDGDKLNASIIDSLVDHVYTINDLNTGVNQELLKTAISYLEDLKVTEKW